MTDRPVVINVFDPRMPVTAGEFSQLRSRVDDLIARIIDLEGRLAKADLMKVDIG